MSPSTCSACRGPSDGQRAPALWRASLVVAIEQAVAAPFCTARLADAGARVIKIERPEGDFARGYDDVAAGQSSYFVWLNRGKESLVVDLASDDGQGDAARPARPGRRAGAEPEARRARPARVRHQTSCGRTIRGWSAAPSADTARPARSPSARPMTCSSRRNRASPPSRAVLRRRRASASRSSTSRPARRPMRRSSRRCWDAASPVKAPTSACRCSTSWRTGSPCPCFIRRPGRPRAGSASPIRRSHPTASSPPATAGRS